MEEVLSALFRGNEAEALIRHALDGSVRRHVIVSLHGRKMGLLVNRAFSSAARRSSASFFCRA
jgi:hypothetical protein